MGLDFKLVSNTVGEIKSLVTYKFSRPFLKLDDFCNENRHLFTVLGVFGALSIYLNTIIDKTDYTQEANSLAIGAGFGIVSILSLVVIVKIAMKASETEGAFFSFENAGLLLFGFFFFFLTLLLVGLSSNSANIWALLFMFGILLAMALVPVKYFKALDWVSESIEHRLPVSKSIPFLLALLFTTAIGLYMFYNTSLLTVDMYSKLSTKTSTSTWIKASYVLPSLIIIILSYSLLILSVLAFIITVGLRGARKIMATISKFSQR